MRTASRSPARTSGLVIATLLFQTFDQLGCGRRDLVLFAGPTRPVWGGDPGFNPILHQPLAVDRLLEHIARLLAGGHPSG